MGDRPEGVLRLATATSVLFLLLLSGSVLLADDAGAAGLPEGRQVDTQFWQDVLNKTAEGNADQAFSMVLAKVSDDLAGAMDRINEFLDGVRRNVTSVIQEGVKKKAGSAVDKTRK